MKALTPETWISWMGAMVLGVAATVAFAYSTFETKEYSKERADAILQRLDQISAYTQRIDEKVDQIISDRRR